MIESMTEEQKSKMAEWRDKWIAIGLSCEPLDLERAKVAVAKSYCSAGLEPPPHYIVCDSPLSAAIVASIIKSTKSVGDSVWASVRDSVGASVRASVRDMIYGSHDAGWLSFYSFMRSVVGLEKQTESLVGLMDLAHHCGWWSPYQNVAILQHRHCELHHDNIGRLHNESGMAVKYRDGWGVYAWHGVKMPRWVIESPQEITPKRIKDETNQEIRRVMMERYGWERWLKEVDARLVDRHPDPRVGELWEFDDQADKIRILHAQNGTSEYDALFGREVYRQFFIRVPIRDGNTKIDSAVTAGRWTYPALWNTMSDQEYLEATTSGRT